MDKGKVIFLGIIGFIVILMVIYVISVFGPEKSSKQKDFHVPNIVKDESRLHYESRLQKANAGRNEDKGIDLSRSMEFQVYESDSNQLVNTDFIALEVEKPVENIQPRTTQTNPKSSKTQAYPSPTPNAQVSQTKDVSVDLVAPDAPAKQQQRSGFGVVQSPNQNTSPQTPASLEDKFLQILLEESVVIKDNSNVVFILLEDISINNITFKKNSFAFGRAKSMHHFFDIQIYQIKNTDGKLYNVSDHNLYVFDEKYSRGFPFEGKLNEAVKDGTLEGVGSTSTTTLGAVETGARVADRIINRATRKTEPSVSLIKGYRVYLKIVNN